MPVKDTLLRRVRNHPLGRFALCVFVAHFIAAYASWLCAEAYLWKAGEPAPADWSLWLMRIVGVGFFWPIEVWDRTEWIIICLRQQRPLPNMAFSMVLVGTYLIILVVLFGLTGRMKWFQPIRVGFCRVCGYDLRATPLRCPECGKLVNG